VEPSEPLIFIITMYHPERTPESNEVAIIKVVPRVSKDLNFTFPQFRRILFYFQLFQVAVQSLGTRMLGYLVRVVSLLAWTFHTSTTLSLF
jgi:hypothetical protein